MKIIFLDMDGVLNNMSWVSTEYHKTGISPYSEDRLDPANVKALNRLIKHGGAKVVISSSWRLIFNQEGMQDVLDKNGVKCEVISMTPDLAGRRQRGDEITKWLQDNICNMSIESYVVLDDSTDMDAVVDRFVNTSPDEGLTEADVDKALRILQTPWDDLP